MTHLDPHELTDALEGTLDTTRMAHLDGCSKCQAAVAESRELLRAVSDAAPVPEPSPLFWTHLSDRIRDAVDAEPTSPGRPWAGWRAYAALASVVGLVVLAVWVDRRVPATAVEDGTVATEVWLESADRLVADRPWERAGEAVATLPSEQVDRLMMPGAADVSVLLTDLSATERQTLAQLLEAEMAGTP